MSKQTARSAPSSLYHHPLPLRNTSMSPKAPISQVAATSEYLSVSRRGTPLLVAAASLLLPLTGCDDEFASRTVLEGYRVVGVEASPPEATPSDAVLLTAHDFYDGSEPLSYQWSVCAVRDDDASGTDCADADYEFELGTESSVMLDMSREGLDFQSLLQDIEVQGEPVDLQRGVDVWVLLDSGPQCAGCERIRTQKRVRLREGEGAANQNPVIRSFDVIGDVEAGATVTLRVSADAPETYVDTDTGERVEEEFLYTWYTSGGETDPALTFGDTRETKLTMPKERGEVTLMVAVRDGRGGLAVETLVVTP